AGRRRQGRRHARARGGSEGARRLRRPAARPGGRRGPPRLREQARVRAAGQGRLMPPEDTRAVARLPNLEIEIRHRHDPEEGAEILAVTLKATPNLEAAAWLS